MAMNALASSSTPSDSVITSASLIGAALSKDESIKSQFLTREGSYRLMAASEYSRPSRVGYGQQQQLTPVKVSFVQCPEPGGHSSCIGAAGGGGGGGCAHKICFNVGRELYVYSYKGIKKAADLTKPIDKRVYKGTYPTCHDFNQSLSTSDIVYLLIGFSAGQIQLIDPITKEISKLYNEERMIDKSKVTCLKWIPGSPNLFLVSHSSGQLYIYKEELPCGTAPPHYQVFKQGDGFAVYTCKTKSTRNPLYRWVVGEGSLNEFAFSPCSKYLATVSQDGFLRVFNYDSMELVGRMRSYFGGLLCVGWSPDGKYVVTGGEDDLVTVWSLLEKRVIARGQGHKSWVSVVAFDPYTTSIGDFVDLSGSDEDIAQQVQPQTINDPCANNGMSADAGTTGECITSTSVASGVTTTATSNISAVNFRSSDSFQRSNSKSGSPVTITSYRFGSVGQDTHLCLWDLSDDVLKQPVTRSRTSILLHSPSTQPSSISSNNVQQANSVPNHFTPASDAPSNACTHNSSNSSKHTLDTLKKEHKRNFSLSSRNSEKNTVNKACQSKLIEDPVRLLGTTVCPRLDEVPMLEPLICKKIAHERITALVFKEDCFVTACQEGFVCTWARPGTYVNMQVISSPSPSYDDIDADDMDVLKGTSTIV